MLEILQNRPRFTETDAARLAAELFGLKAVAHTLHSERDQNFHIKSDTGREFVLKVSNSGESRDILDFQNKALDWLEARGESCCFPKVCTASSGEKIATVPDGNGVGHFVRLLTYLPGTFLARVQPQSPDLMRAIGRFMASMDMAFSSFSHPAAARVLQWDLRNAEAVITRTRVSIDSSERREMVDYFLRLFEQAVLLRFPQLRKSVIHNDGNDHNLLISPSGRDVAGIIDFGDMVRTFTAAEPAITAAYIMLGKTDPVTAAAHVFSGYHEIHPFTEVEFEVLYALICGRLATSVCLSAHQRKQDPSNAYLSISEDQAWETLGRLKRVDPRCAGAVFKNACIRIAGSMKGEEILRLRKQHFSTALSVSYRKPLNIVRGHMQYLYDEAGRAYLDAVNNVAHVGHCHPKVVAAARNQMALLNTNTRYLGENLVAYAQRLCATLPEPLRVCFFVCSGSEANDLALRLARIHTGQKDIVVVDHAYHGNLTSLIEISPYKFDGPGGQGAPPHVHKVPMPDGYRGPYKYDDPNAGEKYAGFVAEAISSIRAAGRDMAAFICESALGCGGQIFLPPGYLKSVIRQVRDAGGVLIADEVQIGFGRVGSHFWGFDTQDVVPDIVTMGKPIGNGHPLAAVVTTPEIAAAFENGMEYFNTYGGNPVSCAVGIAVLEVMAEEQLQANALRVGNHMKAGLGQLMEKHPLIGDVRGQGLFLGIEFVLDRGTLAPATAQAGCIVERMRDNGILLSTDGPLHNVIKIKPPLVFTVEDADLLVGTMDRILCEDFAHALI